MGRNALTYTKVIFWANLRNLFDLEEAAVVGVFEVIEFESVDKEETVPFLVALDPIFAQNLGIIREWWIVWSE